MLDSTIRHIAVNETLNKWFHSVLAVKFSHRSDTQLRSSKVTGDLVQRRQAGGHGAEQGLVESGSGEFAGIADDQPSLACDEIKVGQARP